MSNPYDARGWNPAADRPIAPFSARAAIALAPAVTPGGRGTLERANYFIDRFRVGYQYGGGWTCGCADFATSGACRHTREGAGRLAAQGRIIERIRNGSLQPITVRGQGAARRL